MTPVPDRHSHHRSQAGFSLPEVLIATTVLLIVSSMVTSAMLQMTNSQKTIWNRTEMHSGVRGATELLQQEVGQAGRVALPGTVTLAGAVTSGTQTVTLNSAAGMFAGEQLLVGSGSTQETVTLTLVNTSTNQVTAQFRESHGIGTAVMTAGGFATGIVPPGMTNGSDDSHLKLYGDVNGDGNMVYVEYTCDTTNHYLYRNMLAWNATSKSAPSAAQVLLSNIIDNPGGTACFTYQTAVVGTVTYVIDVAITLTVQTQQIDPITRQYQTETKALLNVSPRNVFNTWQLASVGYLNRVQPMPQSIQNLLP